MQECQDEGASPTNVSSSTSSSSSSLSTDRATASTGASLSVPRRSRGASVVGTTRPSFAQRPGHGRLQGVHASVGSADAVVSTTTSVDANNDGMSSRDAMMATVARLRDDGAISREDPEELFELTEKLGKGAHGVVYLAVNRKTGESLAVKKLEPQSSEAFQEIVNEIQVLRQLESEHCVTYYDSYAKDSFLWIAMEYMNRGAIGDQLAYARENCIASNIGEDHVSVVAGQVLAGLCYLHAMKKIHRDVKNENILINSSGEVKLADFGIAADAMGRGRTTQIGTPYWMAPEIIIGTPYDSKVDIWSLGMSVFDLMEPEHPFFRQSAVSALYSVASKEPPRLEGSYSPELEDFVGRCLVKDPQQRATARELLSHPFIVAHELRAKPVIRDLCRLYEGLRKASPTVLAITGKPEFDAKDQEGVVSFYMVDGSYRTLLVKAHETVADVIGRLIHKLGFIMIPQASFSIYLVTDMGVKEELLDQLQHPIALTKALGDTPHRFLFKQQPNEDMFIALSQLVSDCAAGDTIVTSASLRAIALRVFTDPACDVIAALCTLNDSWRSRVSKQASTSASASSASASSSSAANGSGAGDRRSGGGGGGERGDRRSGGGASSPSSQQPQRGGSRSDTFYQSVLTVCGGTGHMLDVFQVVCRKDLACTVSLTDLFSGRSVTGQLMSGYTKLVGGAYLRAVVAPAIEAVLTCEAAETLLHSQPHRKQTMLEYSAGLVRSGIVEPGLAAVGAIARQILDNILASLPLLPMCFRRIMKEVRDLVHRCFLFSMITPNVVERFFLFNKFVLPALASPHSFGLMETTPPDWACYVFMLLSKLIKAVTVGGRMGERDQYLAIFTEDLRATYVEPFAAFFTDLTDVPEDWKEVSDDDGDGDGDANGDGCYADVIAEEDVNTSLQVLCDEVGRSGTLALVGQIMGVLPVPPSLLREDPTWRKDGKAEAVHGGGGATE